MTNVDTEPTETPSERGVAHLLAEWRAADLVTQEQVETITAYHHAHHREVERSRGFGRMVAVASTLGAVLVGAGILLVVASNWDSMTPLTKTILAITAVVVIEAVGYAVRFRTGFRHTGEALLFVGAVAYGGALFLVAQVYNRPLDDPNLFVFWLIPVFPLAYVVRSRLITALSIVVTFGVIAYRISDWVPSDTLIAVAATYLLVGAACVSIGGVHRDVEPLRYAAPPWEWLGTAAVVVVLFVGSFRGVAEHRASGWIAEIEGPLVAILIGCGVVVAAGIVVRTALHRRFDRDVALTAAICVIAVMAAAEYIATPNTAELVAFATTNILLMAMIVTLVVGGIATRRESLVNIAIVLFAVTVMARYLEIGAGMLGTGAAMIVGGLLLIGMGIGLEVFRRSLVRHMHEEEVAT